MAIDGVNGSTQAIGEFDLGSVTNSPQLKLAMLLMKLSEINKKSAMDGIHSIEEQQKQKQACAELLNQAREYKGSSSNYTKQAGGEPYTSSEFNKAVEAMGLSVPDIAGDKEKNDKQWDKLIAQLQTKLDNMGSNIQTQMVQIQDWMGQYNSYLQGANTQITNSNQLLTTLARGQ